MNILDTFLISLFYLKLHVMHHDFVARMGIKVAKASAYQNHGLMMARKTVMMVQMKKVGSNSKLITSQVRVMLVFCNVIVVVWSTRPALSL